MQCRCSARMYPSNTLPKKDTIWHCKVHIFVFNKEKWEELESRMEAAGKSKEEIDSKKYYTSCLFINCEEREMPPPSIVCWRVRAVFAIYGTMIGSKAGMPLFNKQAPGVLE